MKPDLSNGAIGSLSACVRSNGIRYKQEVFTMMEMFKGIQGGAAIGISIALLLVFGYGFLKQYLGK